MAGKPRKDRSTIADKHVGLRLTNEEFEMLWAVVEATNQRMYEAGYPPAMTATSMLRMLVQHEAVRLGILKRR